MHEDAPNDGPGTGPECPQSVQDAVIRLMCSKIVIRLMIMMCIFGVAPNVSTSTLNEIFLILG